MRTMNTGSGKWLTAILTTATVLMLLPQPSHAIPAFARKYDVTCFTCHTVFPRLNKTGYLFKRLGYRMIPDLEEGQAAPSVRSLDSSDNWKLGNAAALMVATSASAGRTKSEGETESTNSINLDEAALFLGGSVPQSSFSYFAEDVLYEDGESTLERAKVDYVGGNAASSFFIGIGKTHLQEGFRASDMHGLVEADAPLGFMVPSLNNFSLDQNPGLVEAGYTWASPYYAQALGLTVKVSNGLDAEGEGIASGSESKHKDVWAEGDFLFGPDGGISVMGYRGRKPQIQNEGTANEFAYDPVTKRFGVFGNYLFADKLDLLAGYLHTSEDWQAQANDSLGEIKGRSWFGEVDYYLATGFAAFGRYDNVRDTVQDDPAAVPMKTEGFLVGLVRTLVDRGNVKASLTYGHQKIQDVDGVVAKVDEGKAGLIMAW